MSSYRSQDTFRIPDIQKYEEFLEQIKNDEISSDKLKNGKKFAAQLKKDEETLEELKKDQKLLAQYTQIRDAIVAQKEKIEHGTFEKIGIPRNFFDENEKLPKNLIEIVKIQTIKREPRTKEMIMKKLFGIYATIQLSDFDSDFESESESESDQEE